MTIRAARPHDAQAILDIYAPIVRDTAISFEVEPPSLPAMRERIASTLQAYPWLVSEDAAGLVDGYVYATRHKERAAYRWSVETTAYVRADARGRGVGRRLYARLLQELAALGHHQAFAVIVLPNAASVAMMAITVRSSTRVKPRSGREVTMPRSYPNPRTSDADPERKRGLFGPPSVAAVPERQIPASFRSASARSVASHLNSGSARPKWPPDAVRR